LFEKISMKKEHASGSGDSEDKLGDIWITNRRRVVLFFLVLVSSLSLPYFRKLNEIFPNAQPAFPAILAGIIVTCATYLPARYVDEKYALSHAALLGMLVAEFVVYGAPLGFPTPVVISFFYFMFYIAESEADALWPKKESLV
jgi:hypothetical protein